MAVETRANVVDREMGMHATVDYVVMPADDENEEK